MSHVSLLRFGCSIPKERALLSYRDSVAVSLKKYYRILFHVRIATISSFLLNIVDDFRTELALGEQVSLASLYQCS